MCFSVLFGRWTTKPVERPPSLGRPASLNPANRPSRFQTAQSFPSPVEQHPDLCLDLRLKQPLLQHQLQPREQAVGQPQLIYEPFYTVLLPLETLPWPTLHGTLLALNTYSTPAGPVGHGWWLGFRGPLDLSLRGCHTLTSTSIKARQTSRSTS